MTTNIFNNTDLLKEIFSIDNIDRGSDYKAIIATCRLWHATLASVNKSYLYMNVLSTFIAQGSPTFDYLMYFVSHKVTLKTIDVHIATSKCINWSDISKNPRITEEFIRKHTDDLDWVVLSEHVHITRELLCEFHDNWSVGGLSLNPTLTADLIHLHYTQLHGGHDYHHLAHNPNMTIDLATQFGMIESCYDSFIISSNIRLFEEQIINWDDSVTIGEINKVSTNPHITPAIIRAQKNRLRWNPLSCNRALTMPLIREFIDYISWDFISWNPNLDMEFIRDNLSRLVVEHLSGDHLDSNFIDDNIDKLNWNLISTKIPLDTLIKHSDKIHWKSVLMHNPNITLEFLQSHFTLSAEDFGKKYVELYRYST
jgi:hypothetical protein